MISKVKGDGNEEMRGKFGRILGDFKLNDGDTLTSKLMSEGHVLLVTMVVTRKRFRQTFREQTKIS